MDKDKLLITVLGVSVFALASCGENGEPDPTPPSPPPPSSSLSLTETELTLKIGTRDTLTLVGDPSGDFIWESDDAGIVEVEEGIIHAVRNGTATITVSDGASQSAQCVVTVSPRGGYHLVWEENFDGTALNTDAWKYYTGTAPNQELQLYTNKEENIRMENGLLIIELRKEANGSYTSARISTQDKKHFTYGKIEARINFPAGRGTWPAFWMTGTVGKWPASGEIDIVEHVGFDPTLVAHSLHTKTRYGGNRLLGYDGHIDNVENEFHTYGIEWINNDNGPFDIIKFYVDDEVRVSYAETPELRRGGNWPFDTPFYVILNLAWGGTWGGQQKEDPDGDGILDNGVDDSIFNNPVQMKVDWVRVYQYQ
jgi:beta-glucanase (GH16 family)